MNVSSLRPERSASANSATPAWEVRVVFYLKRLFCQMRSGFTESWEQIFLQHRHRYIPCKIVLPTHYSTVRGCTFLPRTSLYYSYQTIKKGVANVIRTRSSGCFVIACPRRCRLVRRPI